MGKNHLFGDGLFPLFLINYAFLAQLVEQLIRNEQVAGSSPAKGSFFSSAKLQFKLGTFFFWGC